MANPYDKTTHDGKTVDWLTHCALLEAELKLGYRLTIVQGSYHKGVGASAGTHDGGGVIDLAPWDHVRKVRVLRDLGFAIWHRPALPGVWNEHCHGVLIGNEKLSPAAANQVPAYKNHRDGLAGNRPDNTYRPDPIPTYKWPGSDAALALEAKAKTVLDGPKKPNEPGWNPSTGPLPVDLIDLSHWNTVTTAGVKKARAAGVKGFYHKATEGTTFVDPNFDSARHTITEAGGTFGAYHFARPSQSDGTTQAKRFLSVATPKRGTDLRIMLDLEDRGGKTKAALTTWVGEFVAEVVKQTGVKVHLIYTGFDLGDDFGWWLWVARYHDKNALPNIPAPWTRWKVRQFSNGVYGNPKEVPGFIKVDLNNVVGPVSALKMPAPKKPPPPPPPKGATFVNAQFNSQHTDRANRQIRDVLIASDLVGLNEVESLWQRIILKTSPKFGVYPTLGTGGYVPVCWRKTVFEKVDARTIKATPGRKGVSPTRNVVEVDLRHKATGAVITRRNTQVNPHIEVSGHARKYTAAELPKYAGWLELAKSHFDLLRSRMLLDKNPAITGGDFNVDYLAEKRLAVSKRTPWFPLTSLASIPGVEVHIPADGTHGKRAIDWTLTRGLKFVRQWKGKHGASDHDAVYTEVELS